MNQQLEKLKRTSELIRHKLYDYLMFTQLNYFQYGNLSFKLSHNTAPKKFAQEIAPCVKKYKIYITYTSLMDV